MATYLGGTHGTPLKGTDTNDNATSGNVGETVNSAVTNVSLPTSTHFGDLTSISLTAGDWLVSVIMELTGASPTATLIATGISTTTGDSNAGLNSGDNYAAANITSGTITTLCVPSYRMSLASTTIVYAKMTATYTGGTQAFQARISAVRIR